MGTMLDRLLDLACSSESDIDAPFCPFKSKVAPVEFVFIGASRHVTSCRQFLSFCRRAAQTSLSNFAMQST
jgi:hypothetical protein